MPQCLGCQELPGGGEHQALPPFYSLASTYLLTSLPRGRLQPAREPDLLLPDDVRRRHRSARRLDDVGMAPQLEPLLRRSLRRLQRWLGHLEPTATPCAQAATLAVQAATLGDQAATLLAQATRTRATGGCPPSRRTTRRTLLSATGAASYGVRWRCSLTGALHTPPTPPRHS